MMALKASIGRTDGKISEWFDEMADAAIRRSELVVAGKRLAILEVEFYLYRAGHEDPYVHRSAEQMNTNGEWYFHREKAAKIGFTLKGLDLTFGEAGKEAGGMLIRAVANAKGGGYVEGPSKVVDVILEAAGVPSVTELKALGAYDNRAFAEAGLLRLEERGVPSTEPIHTGPRVGLKGCTDYSRAAYRYRARPALTKKDKPAIMAGRRVIVRTAPCGPLPCAPQTAPSIPAPQPSRLTDEEVDTLLSGLLDGAPEGATAPASVEVRPPEQSWGIVGYRFFTDRERFDRALEGIVQERGQPTRVVSGGATGADTLACEWAQANGIAFLEHAPVSNSAADLKARNTLIVRDSTLIIAFLSAQSRGTWDTINKARIAGKPVLVIDV